MALPPSEEEATRYYCGLPTAPALVARSSNAPWVPRMSGGYFKRKDIGIVEASHPIAKAWNRGGPLQRSIVEALAGTPWTSVDVVHIHYEDEDIGPLKLRISVKRGSIRWAAARALIKRCLKRLEEHGLCEVEVEVKEPLERDVDTQLLGNVDDVDPSPAHDIKLWQWPSEEVSHKLSEGSDFGCIFSELLGVSIASHRRPWAEGTKGPYLRCRTSGKVFMLTCRSVLFDPSFKKEYSYSQGGADRREVVQPGDVTCWKAENESFSRLNAYESDLLRRLRGAQKRVIGHIFFSPAPSQTTTSSGGRWIRDWALVELHQSKHTTELGALQNRAPYAGLRDFWNYGQNLHHEVISAVGGEPMRKRTPKGCTGGAWDLYQVPHEDEIRSTAILGGAVPEDELWPPAEDRTASGDDPLFFVLKHGRRTKRTLGIVNPVQSLRRCPYGTDTYSQDMCMIGGLYNHSLRGLFATLGDSGAAAWDLQGRIAAMVLSADAADVDTISYATPMVRLLEDIRSFGFDVEIM